MKRPGFLMSAAAMAFFIPATAARAQIPPAYHLVTTVVLGAPDRWDYVVFDRTSHRVYVAHGDRVTVIDGRDGTIVGNIEGMPGATHGIGISTATGRGYTDDGQAGEAVSFDLKTLKVTKRIKAAEDADGIVMDPKTGHIFVVNGFSKTLTVIDPQSNSAVATIDGGGRLEYAVVDGAGKLYVNGSDNNEIVRIDTATNRVDGRWPIPGCISPRGLAIDNAAHRLFSTCLNAVLTVINADNGAVVATLPIGQGTDGATFDPKRRLVFSSNNDGTLTVIEEKDSNTFIPRGSITTAFTGRTMAIDPDTGRLFVAAAEIDPTAAVPAGRGGGPGRPRPIPGSLKLLIIDPP